MLSTTAFVRSADGVEVAFTMTLLKMDELYRLARRTLGREEHNKVSRGARRSYLFVFIFLILYHKGTYSLGIYFSFAQIRI